MTIKVGDYLLTEEYQIFRIMDVYEDTKGVYYDIKSIRSEEIALNSDTYTYGQDTVWLKQDMPRLIRSVPQNVLKYMGRIIPEEKITKTLKILYK